MPALKEWVATQIERLEENGLSYPFGTLSFVEVPTSLRVYGGGWKMGSAYSPPGIHMIRESGFPIAQFERAKTKAEEEFGDDQEGIGNYLFEHVRIYFQNDLHGGSPMVSLGEQFLGYQATPHGKGATALHAFVNEIAANVALEGEGLFSIYLILDDDVVLQTTTRPNDWFSRNFIDLIRGGQINRSRVWEPALRTALADLDFETQPKTANDVVLLKSHAISRTIRELVPQQNISAFLGRLISEYRGRNYSPEDFLKFARDMEIDFDILVGDWLNSTELPGFIVHEPSFEYVREGEYGAYEFQTSVVIRNDESVPGAIGIEYWLRDHHPPEDLWADTVHFPAHTALRVALRTAKPLESLTLHPHLALNRTRYYFHPPNTRDALPRGSASPYIEEYDWVPVEDESIIVDDLSDGFTILNGREHQPPPEKPSVFEYILFREPNLFNPNLNHGLPSLRAADDFAQRGDFSLWFRESEQTSHGKYYRTYATNPTGSTESQPQFAAQLPSVGRWLLEFHVPSIGRERYPIGWRAAFGIVTWQSSELRDLGVHRFEIDVGDTTELTELDLSEVSTGWNQLGIFETSSQDVRVTLVAVTDGVAIADAVRWTPVE